MKKVFTFSLISILALCTNLKAQDTTKFWKILPFPDTLDIQCVTVNHQGDILVGTNTNTTNDGVFRSEDGGMTWSLILDMGLYGPSSIAVTDNGTIFILGNIPGWYLTK